MINYPLIDPSTEINRCEKLPPLFYPDKSTGKRETRQSNAGNVSKDILFLRRGLQGIAFLIFANKIGRESAMYFHLPLLSHSSITLEVRLLCFRQDKWGSARLLFNSFYGR